jgi:hypothetical protein
MFGRKKKPLERKCKNCRLYDSGKGHCSVIVLNEGQRFNLPVYPDDECFFEGEFSAINEEGAVETFKPDIQQVKLWVEDKKTGKKTDGNGIVKIEYPQGFFGDEGESISGAN